MPFVDNAELGIRCSRPVAHGRFGHFPAVGRPERCGRMSVRSWGCPTRTRCYARCQPLVCPAGVRRRQNALRLRVCNSKCLRFMTWVSGYDRMIVQPDGCKLNGSRGVGSRPQRAVQAATCCRLAGRRRIRSAPDQERAGDWSTARRSCAGSHVGCLVRPRCCGYVGAADVVLSGLQLRNTFSVPLS